MDSKRLLMTIRIPRTDVNIHTAEVDDLLCELHLLERLLREESAYVIRDSIGNPGGGVTFTIIQK